MKLDFGRKVFGTFSSENSRHTYVWSFRAKNAMQTNIIWQFQFLSVNFGGNCYIKYTSRLNRLGRKNVTSLFISLLGLADAAVTNYSSCHKLQFLSQITVPVTNYSYCNKLQFRLQITVPEANYSFSHKLQFLSQIIVPVTCSILYLLTVCLRAVSSSSCQAKRIFIQSHFYETVSAEIFVRIFRQKISAEILKRYLL
jgi:hypothetical protein